MRFSFHLDIDDDYDDDGDDDDGGGDGGGDDGGGDSDEFHVKRCTVENDDTELIDDQLQRTLCQLRL